MIPFWKRLFISLTVVSIISWTLPPYFPGASGPNHLLKWNDENLRPVIRDYVLWTGLFQVWNMFIHKANQPNVWLDAFVEIDFTSQTDQIETLAFPKVRDMKNGEYWQGYRYRKFLDYANSAVAPHLFKNIALYYGRDYFKRTHSRPKAVKIMQKVRQIPEFGKAWPDFRRVELFNYQYLPGDSLE